MKTDEKVVRVPFGADYLVPVPEAGPTSPLMSRVPIPTETDGRDSKTDYSVD